MQQLLKVHTTVRDIREHQSQIRQDLDSSCRGKGFGSSDSLEQVLEKEPDTEKPAVNKEKPVSTLSVPKLTPPVRLPPPSFEVNAPTHLKKDADDQVLCDFLGEEHMKKLSLLGKYQQGNNKEPPLPPAKPKRSDTSSKFLKSFSTPSYNQSASAGSSVECKPDATPQEGRNSVLFDMQKFHQKLQMTAFEELAAINKALDVCPTSSISPDEDTSGYRYSILNHMDEILGPTSPGRKAGHVRQCSEPVIPTGFGREQSKRLYTSEEAARMGGYKVFAQVNNGQLPQSRTPPSSRSMQATPEQIYHSLRRPSKTKVEMTRTNSDGIPQADSVTNQLSTQHGADAKNAVPYDTGVVKKRRSRTEFDKPRHPLQYSVESLNEGQAAENGGSSSQSPGHSSAAHTLGDDDGIEHKSIGHRYKTDSLPNYSKSVKPKLQTKLSAPSWNQTLDASSADVYPETSSSSHDIKPYMTTSQARSEMDEFLNRTEADKYVYKPYSQLKSQRSRPDSAPVKKHAVNVHSSNRTFL